MRRYHHDPVCGIKISKSKAFYTTIIDNKEFLLCCPECQTKFTANQEEYIKKINKIYSKNKSKTKSKIY